MAGGYTQGMVGLGTLDTLGSLKTQYPSTRHASGYPWPYSLGMDQQVEMGGARQHMVPTSFIESLKEFSPALPGIGTGLFPPQPGGDWILGDPTTGGEEKYNGGGNLPRVPNDPTGRTDEVRELPRPEGGHWNVVSGLPGSGNPQFSWAKTGGPAVAPPLLEDISPRIGMYKNPVTPGYEQYMDLHPNQRFGIDLGFYAWSPETGKWESTGKGRGGDWRLGDQFHNPNKPYDPNIMFNRGGLLGQQQGGGGMLGNK